MKTFKKILTIFGICVIAINVGIFAPRAEVAHAAVSVDVANFAQLFCVISANQLPTVSDSYTNTTNYFCGGTTIADNDIDIAITASFNFSNVNSIGNPVVLYIPTKNFTIHSADLSNPQIITRDPADTTVLLYVNGGSLTLANIIIDGNGANVQATEVMVAMSTGTLNITDGTVLRNNNRIANYGGGAMTISGGNFNMTGGLITDNRALGAGGISFGNNNSSLTAVISGGEIIGNTAYQATGGGIRLGITTTNGNSFSVNVIGKTVIANNTAATNGGGIGGYDDPRLQPYLTVGPNVVFSGNTAATTARIDPSDQSLYDTNILATSFSLPAPFNGYNNYDIQYAGTLPTDICQYNSSLWADDTNCVKPTEPTLPPTEPVVPGAPNTGLFLLR